MSGVSPAVAAFTYGGKRLDFAVVGKRAFLIKPSLPAADGTRPWLWYQPTFLGPHPTDPAINPGGAAYPNENQIWLFTQLVDQGFWIGGVEIGETFGNPSGRAAQTAFYEAVIAQYGLAPRVCLLPQSRGGLMHYNWAAERPQWVERIGAIYPVTDIRSWLGVEHIAQRGYGLTAAEMLAQMGEHNPIERLAPLAAHNIPIMHVHGDQDAAVDLEQNSLELARRYRALGGEIEVVVIPGRGHDVSIEIFQSPRLLEFFLAGHSR